MKLDLTGHGLSFKYQDARYDSPPYRADNRQNGPTGKYHVEVDARIASNY